MTTQFSSKLIALAAALMMNSLILGAVAYVFNDQSRPHVVLSLAQLSGSVGAKVG